MHFKYTQSIIFLPVFLFVLAESTGCTKFVKIDPPVTQITATTVYNNNTSAAAVMTGIYSNLMTNQGISSGNNSIGYLQGLAADELTNYSTDPMLTQFYSNSLSSSTGGSSNTYYWGELYQEIHVTNTVIEGLANSSGVTVSMKQQITGEAKFMRAFLHFYATNLYGDVPLITTTNYLNNNSISRTPIKIVYQQIIQDLKDAETSLSDSYLNAYGTTTTEKTRPNKGAAEALLARAYLYTNKWDSAETVANSVINNTTNYSLDSLNDVFLSNSTEAIWQLSPVNPGYNTYDAYDFVLTSAPGTGQFSVALSNNLLKVFEAGDERLVNWVGEYTDGSTPYYYPYKYKVNVDDEDVPITEYVMVLRLAEQYLIRAEARAQQGNIAGAQTDLNFVRRRAGLSNTTANDLTSLLTAISHERQVEFFTEWGHRWLDLKRTNTVNTVMSDVTPKKGGSWSPNWALMPLPLGDIQININLKQNPGY